MQRIPVVVIAGFLGSGKTTLVNHLLRTANGTRIGVVVNDFGDVNIDGMLVAGQVDSMVTLGGGCLCCAVDVADLDAMLGRLADQVDVIVVEASGLAEPGALVKMVIGSANRAITYGGLVEVVDAVEFARTRERHPEIDQHLHLADLVVVNKADLVDELPELPGPVLVTTHGRVDPSLLFDRAEQAPPIAGAQLSLADLDCDHDHEHMHDQYTTETLTPDGPLDRDGLFALLEGCYRAKGFVRLRDPDGRVRKYLLHKVGRAVDLEPQRAAKGERSGVIVTITPQMSGSP